MPIPEDIDRATLLVLLRRYDQYVQDVNDENRYQDGWFPVCLNEFYDVEFQEVYREKYWIHTRGTTLTICTFCVDTIDGLGDATFTDIDPTPCCDICGMEFEGEGG